MKSLEKKTVLVTGFGPFGSHKINSSWEAAKELKNLGLGVEGVELVIEKVPVLYDSVDKIMPSLLETHQPCLVVSIGLSSHTKNIELEQFANCLGYNRVDNDGKCPNGERCQSVMHIPSGDKFKSDIDMLCVTSSNLLKSKKIHATVSNDAGQFLCDYIYCTGMSLQRQKGNRMHNAFIHVPPLDKPFNAIQLAEQIQIILQAMLLQLAI